MGEYLKKKKKKKKKKNIFNQSMAFWVHDLMNFVPPCSPFTSFEGSNLYLLFCDDT
jgi:hypothetical protein